MFPGELARLRKTRATFLAAATGAGPLRIQPREEWRQEYLDAWRIFRDWFYDPNLHGVDWKALRDRYAEELPYMSTRSDLDYLLTELGGEVSVGHAYVQPAANPPGPKRVEGALLGAEVEADSGYFKVTHIFPGENWHPDFRSPLTDPGVDVKTGDYILAVDGQPVSDLADFYTRLWAQGSPGALIPLRLQREEDVFEVEIRSADRTALLKRPRFN